MPKIEFSKLNIVFALLAVIILGAIFFLTKKPTNQAPSSFILQVPFSAQAPTDNWNRNEDCEEASITMANAFLTGNTQNELPPGPAQEAINNLRKWEAVNLGYNADTGADATTRMAQGAFGLTIKQISNFTKEDLKTELTNNHPILLPINAKFLGSHWDRNPFELAKFSSFIYPNPYL